MAYITNILNLIFLSIFSFSINFYFGNLGVFPIHTFAFLDTGYLILKDQIPIKEIASLKNKHIKLELFCNKLF